MDRTITDGCVKCLIPRRKRPHTGGRTAPPMASPFLEFDLTAETDRLHRETTWNTGQNARTLVKYDDLRVVLMVLKASARIPGHKANGRISVHVLSGHVRLNAGGTHI
jgi:quercetin dioxygenase-like cupin family protein